MPVQREFL